MIILLQDEVRSNNNQTQGQIIIMKLNTTTYGAKDIEVLEGLEPVRKRPGMYIGGVDERALHHLAVEIIDNAMDEAIAGHAKKIKIELMTDNYLSIHDDGRGIPTDEHPKFPGKSALEVIVGTLHAGGKFSEGAYKTSGGLHGVGISVVNALSESLIIEVVRDKRIYRQAFSRGHATTKLECLGPSGKRKGTTVFFKPDHQIFGDDIAFSPKKLFKECEAKAYLMSGIVIEWNCHLDLIDTTQVSPSKTFCYPKGIVDFLENKVRDSILIGNLPFKGNIKFSNKTNNGFNGSIEWACNWIEGNSGFLKSFCNLIPTPDGGTHETGFWSSILKGIKSYGELTGNKKITQLIKEDLSYGLCGIISVFVSDPTFSGQTKEKLTSPEVAKLVESSLKGLFENWLAEDPKISNLIIEDLLLRCEERIRRKNERETLRKSSIKKLRLPGKLADCLSNKKTDTELFLVEGDSAGGSAKQARNRHNQAILPLRGKILNVMSATHDKMLQNQEILDLCKCLGVEVGNKFEIESLRYEKIIIMTDADVDGAHISSLLITFFFMQMPELVSNGHLFLAVPPLFKISSGSKVMYANTEQERAHIVEKNLLGNKKADVSRFKGLGEMNPSQLKETTMNPATRKLIKIIAHPDSFESNNNLVMNLMGKNPEPRFEYIISHAEFVDPAII